jgi:F0F1-type ATP synthase membrane subunit c/vacuolar-type H+-ATPase subunit K
MTRIILVALITSCVIGTAMAQSQSAQKACHSMARLKQAL